MLYFHHLTARVAVYLPQAGATTFYTSLLHYSGALSTLIVSSVRPVCTASFNELARTYVPRFLFQLG